jgi:hypothetical protein
VAVVDVVLASRMQRRERGLRTVSCCGLEEPGSHGAPGPESQRAAFNADGPTSVAGTIAVVNCFTPPSVVMYTLHSMIHQKRRNTPSPAPRPDCEDLMGLDLTLSWCLYYGAMSTYYILL